MLSLGKSSRRKFQWRHFTTLPYCREATTCPFAKRSKCLNNLNAMKVQDAQNIIILFVTKIVTIIAINRSLVGEYLQTLGHWEVLCGRTLAEGKTGLDATWEQAG